MKKLLVRIVESAFSGSCMVYTIDQPHISIRIGYNGLSNIDNMQVVGVDMI